MARWRTAPAESAKCLVGAGCARLPTNWTQSVYHGDVESYGRCICRAVPFRLFPLLGKTCRYERFYADSNMVNTLTLAGIMWAPRCVSSPASCRSRHRRREKWCGSTPAGPGIHPVSPPDYKTCIEISSGAHPECSFLPVVRSDPICPGFFGSRIRRRYLVGRHLASSSLLYAYRRARDRERPGVGNILASETFRSARRGNYRRYGGRPAKRHCRPLSRYPDQDHGGRIPDHGFDLPGQQPARTIQITGSSEKKEKKASMMPFFLGICDPDAGRKITALSSHVITILDIQRLKSNNEYEIKQEN